MLRAMNNDCLVDVLAVINNEKPSGEVPQRRMGKNGKGYTILIEKINYRLPDLGTISFRDGIYVLRQGLKAVKVLGSMFQNFLIEEEYIGINFDGECKYWLN
jgi:hypothetical protein